MKLQSVTDCSRYAEERNKYNTGRKQTTWTQMSNETTKMCGHRWASMGESRLGQDRRRYGDGNNDKEWEGKGRWEIRVWGQSMELYVG